MHQLHRAEVSLRRLHSSNVTEAGSAKVASTQAMRSGEATACNRLSKGSRVYTCLASAMPQVVGGMHCDQLLFVQLGRIGLQGHYTTRPVVGKGQGQQSTW